VSQIVRGVVNTPEALIAPRQGKWWNELEGKWVKTSIPDDYTAFVDGKPSDDSDLLGDAEAEVEASSQLSTGEVVEMYYYEVLEVGPQAEPSAIKRRYYLLARQYHPDKVGTDDIEAAEKFKAIAEAYQVLSDPELRKKYDAEGRAGLSADKTSVAGDTPKIDPTILFAFLFGSDKFSSYIGRLSTATSAMVGDSPKVSVETGRIIQHRRVTRLAVNLAEKLEKWVAEDYDLCKSLWETEAADLSTASYGSQLVHLIGKVGIASLCSTFLISQSQQASHYNDFRWTFWYDRFIISLRFNSLDLPNQVLACRLLANGQRIRRPSSTASQKRTRTKWKPFVRASV
jgi:curved DNA-binding protein CbpA